MDWSSGDRSSDETINKCKMLEAKQQLADIVMSNDARVFLDVKALVQRMLSELPAQATLVTDAYMQTSSVHRRL